MFVQNLEILSDGSSQGLQGNELLALRLLNKPIIILEDELNSLKVDRRKDYILKSLK